ncbi:class I SAM-dependent methyltransferase [Marisediminicola sp. LYQ85]|uniref:class I SAM-dependent methyltransferase n=1 Tax=Marisediminicola sp. LYQ85 TaxID=3391062 RepID=UPI003983A7A7
MAIFRRYGVGAKFYDVLSGERFVYRAGRVAGIRALAPARGDVVLDLGCGTGLNFSLLVDAVGPEGAVIGLDASPDMLAMARARIDRAGWRNVAVAVADATAFDPDVVAHALEGAHRSRVRPDDDPATTPPDRPVDGVISTYAMSIFGDWPAAWTRVRAVLRPGGSAAIVDMQVPVGRAAVFGPLARLAAATGGADLTARPWEAVERDGVNVRSVSVRGGHIQVRAAVIP